MNSAFVTRPLALFLPLLCGAALLAAESTTSRRVDRDVSSRSLEALSTHLALPVEERPELLREHLEEPAVDVEIVPEPPPQVLDEDGLERP